MRILLFLISLIFCLSCFASWKQISKIFKELPYGRIDFIRKSKSIIQKEERKVSGNFYFNKSQFLVKDRQLILFDGKNLWIESIRAKTKLKYFKKIPFKKSSFILWTLFNNPSHLKNKFYLKKRKNYLVLKPKGRSDFKEIKIKLKKNKIKYISYTDGLGNKTIFKIIRTLKRKFKSSFFLKKLL